MTDPNDKAGECCDEMKNTDCAETEAAMVGETCSEKKEPCDQQAKTDEVQTESQR